MGFVLSARIFVMRRGQAQGPLIPTSHPPVPTDDGALPRQFCIRLLIFIGEGISIAIRPTSHTNALIWLCVIASLYSYCNEGHDISATEQAQCFACLASVPRQSGSRSVCRRAGRPGSRRASGPPSDTD